MVLCFPGIAKLVSALLATNHQAVNTRLVECRTLDALLDLFFRYSLNNFLHSTVEGCLAQVRSAIEYNQTIYRVPICPRGM